MKQSITIKFKDGRQITAEIKKIDIGLWFIDNEITFNAIHGTLYKVKDNVICGENITDTVEKIDISMEY